MTVVRVDPAAPGPFGEWFGVVEASGADRWPGRPGWQPAELRAMATAGGSGRAVLLLARLEGADRGVPAGAAMVALHDRDNRHLAELEVFEVHPSWRRRGAGSALLAAAEEVAAADGRRVVSGSEEVVLAAGGEWTGGSAGSRFATVHGYGMVLENVRRELAVPLDPGLAERLAHRAAPHAAGYRVATFMDRWPEDWVGERAAFGRHMSTDAPLGGFALEEERWDGGRVRRHEERVAAMGRRLLVAVALSEPEGRPVAFSELTVAPSVPAIAWQWDTLVMPAHRGHRLGMLVKLANLAALAARSPATATVVTWNARANGPMIAVNDALGCQVVAVLRTWQRHLG